MSQNDLETQLAYWRSWVGRSEQRTDTIGAAPLVGLAATLDLDPVTPDKQFEIPALAHWLYFLPAARHREIAEDGHPRRGGFLPPIPQPRRMWAGGRIQFHHPLRFGDEVVRVSTIKNIAAKAGRTGALVFVTVRHEVSNAQGIAVTEEQVLVYRDAPAPGTRAPDPVWAPSSQTFALVVVPDPVLLFRYSALTFNSHRIHYDRSYATVEEGYPGLVVHGPLIATLLTDLLRRERPCLRLRRFEFAAVRPTFDLNEFNLCGTDDGGEKIALWSRDHEGFLTMRAEAQTEPT